jgi:hypothetical protein
MTKPFHLFTNIPAGGATGFAPLVQANPVAARAGCAPFARRGETKGAREALIAITAPTGEAAA